jgi:hypothetical protein
MPKNTVIQDFLSKDYLLDYSEILSTTVSITTYYPQQAESQLRNAITHLARSISDDSDFEAEIEKAKGHIERAKRDCLKLSIIKKKQDVIGEIKSLRYAKGTLTKSIKEKRISIELQLKKASIQETLGAKDVSTLLEVILTELIELESELINIDEIVTKPSTSVKIAYTAIEWFKKASYMIAFGFIAYLIKAYIIPLTS